MKRVRFLLPLTVVAFGLTLVARPCGPDFPEAVFVLQTGPGADYAAYAAGKLGVPQQDYRTRHLIVAYDYLNGHPLPPAVQKEAIAVNDYLLDPWSADNNSDKPLPGYDTWLKARDAFGPVDGYVPDGSLATTRSVPGEDYTDFKNCLDDAFATAAKTLDARVGAHTAKDASVIEWVRGQDAVFTNCGDGKAPPYFGPADKAPAPPRSPRMPGTAAANSPLWLKQDRAYQLAAASFYHLDFDDAIARFRGIAADTSSPWSLTARYLIARNYIRSATLLPQPQGANADQSATKKRFSDALSKAQHELLAMQSEPRMAPMRGAVDGLLDYANLRLQPEAQAAALAARLQSPNAATFRQAELDLTWLHSTHDYDDRPVPVLSSATHPSDMLAWIDAVNGGNEGSALQHWHSTHSTAWLLAAIANARTGNPDTAAMIQAARAIPETDPGWLAITYNRLRLSPRDATTRNEVLALQSQLKKAGDTSTVNLFLELATATASTLNDWLASVPRIPAGDSSYESGEDILSSAVPAPSGAAARSAPPVEDTCGNKYPAGTVLALFDTDAASVLNRDMPLRLLAEAAGGSTLPANLRFQVAQATWARAVLLDKPAIARQMTPILIACRAAWRPVLAAYDAASTDDARHTLGLLALMRFASTVPSVWDGEERREGFATYDEFRQNWWCSAVPQPGESVDSDPDRVARAGGDTSATPGKKPPTPPFLSASDLSEAHTEASALERIPRASTYFAQQALAWQKLHPTDPRTPELLGEADRVLRNACRKDPEADTQGKVHLNEADLTLTPNLAKALFETLHRSYPTSVWAKRYTSWQ